MGIKKEERVGVGVGSGRDRSDLNREEESEWGLSKGYRGRCPEPRAKLLPPRSGLGRAGTCLSEVGKGREQDEARVVLGFPR